MTVFEKVCPVALIMSLGFYGQTSAVDSKQWAAAYVQSGFREPVVTIFPLSGPKSEVDLPASVRNSKGVDFGADGKTLYIQTIRGVVNIQLGSPEDKGVIAGSEGLGSIWSLTAIRPAGRVFVSGIAEGQCGTFEINAVSPEPLAVLAGRYPQCGGGGGVVSPDGMREVRHSRAGLVVADFDNGATRVIKGFEIGQISGDFAAWLHRLAWSPDGRWISVVDDAGRIALVDADSLVRKRYLGRSSGRSPVQWSPDSRYLLVQRSGIKCTLNLYFASLEAVNVETGERTLIKSAQCAIGPGWLGWVDASLIR
jgi:hypothetical protein